MTYAVIPAPADALNFVKFLDHLQSKNKHALGFLPFEALRQAISLQRVFLAYENDQPAGYIIHGKPRENAKIFQVVIADDARRIEHGTALVEAVRQVMMHHEAHTLSLHCAEDLDANAFWQAIGFEHAGTRCRRKDRKRSQNRYNLDLPQKAIAAARWRQQLEADGLTNLQRLLTKGDITLGKMPFRRKSKRTHEIYLPPGMEAGETTNGTR